MLDIPTLFLRDPADQRFVIPRVNPDAQWVLAGEGVATRLYDGVTALFDPDRVWHPVTGPSPHPELAGWYLVTGTGGWEPAWRSRHAARMLAAVRALPASQVPEPGTYELIGPGINRNRDRVTSPVLIAHRDADVLPAPRTYAGLADWLHAHPYAGVVWRWVQPDGSTRRAKLKKRDLPHG